MQPEKLFDLSRLKYTKSLFWLAVISVVGALVLAALWILDPRELLGVSVWEKPLKFFVSSAIFSFTYSWLSSFITRGGRWVKLAGLIIAVSLSVELVLISAMAALGTTSHFNVSSPTAIVVWSLMATFISIVLFSTVFLSLMILFQKDQTFSLKLALALGSINTAVGMGLAYLMTWPSAAQLANYQGIAGAHAVGVSDGGPGLPFLGWSTVAGDLRVGHFFGLHSIQVAAILLAVSLLLPLAFRIPLITVGNITWLGFVGLVTWQSLRAEPFASPRALTLTGLVVLLSVAALSFVLLVMAQSRSKSKQAA
jgi:multisubunit Na+/H+ antiporter MnhC subunit